MNIAERIIVFPTVTIREALKIIDEVAHKTVVVANADKSLCGVVTDGDIRRWILKNGNIEDNISSVMNSNPVVLTPGYLVKDAQAIMLDKMIEAIPVVDDERKIIDICFWRDIFESHSKPRVQFNFPIVIMAGGKGTRLHPFTKILPKPLIPIGDKPIIEHIVDKFRSYGCRDFHVTVNYKAGMMRAYFADIEKDYNVSFLEESKPLGTGGSLHMLDGILNQTFFVSNCDILIDADYSDMLRLHKEKKNQITMVASLKHYTIPYGVISLNENELVKKITEKPELTWLVNTGMYILEPETLRDIPKESFFHITDLINRYLSEGRNVGVYPVSEKAWMDMGQMEEMHDMMKKLGV